MGAQYIVYQPKKILNIHKHTDSWFWDKYSAHPYIGCEHGCEYCYNRERKTKEKIVECWQHSIQKNRLIG